MDVGAVEGVDSYDAAAEEEDAEEDEAREEAERADEE